MPTAFDIPGAVFKQGTVMLLARIVGADNEPIVAADIDAISYSIFALDPCLPNSLTSVDGHDDVALDAEDVISDTLVVSDMWTVDETGHNFSHTIDISEDEAFPTAGLDYQVRYELQPVEGQRIVMRFRLRVV